MKKNAQSVEAWLEAMIAVARYYRLDFSQENVRATVNWERDSKREELLTDMARQLGMGLRLVEFSADSLNPWSRSVELLLFMERLFRQVMMMRLQ